MSKVRENKFTRAAVSVATLGVAAAVGGVAATQPASISASLVDLTALIVVGSSTHPDGTGNENFFGGKFNRAPYNPGGQPGPDLIGVDFRGGPAAINDALQANSAEDNAVLTSGWGAANASLLLMRLDNDDDPVLPKTVFILDNNVSRPDGGFGTRYPWFALIGVNPFPSPTDTTAKAVVDIAYQYNYNSNAPADLFNLVAHVNSLVAYLYGYRNQDEIDLPVDIDGTSTVSCGTANTCAVLASGGDALPCDDARCATPVGDRVVAYVTTRGNTTYVTYTTDELPLARLIRDVVPFGGAIADLTEPLLTLIVDSAYYDGNPIPSDPSRYRPARLMPSLGELVTTVSKVPAAIHEGFEALSDNSSEETFVSDVEPAREPEVWSASRTERTQDDEDAGVEDDGIEDEVTEDAGIEETDGAAAAASETDEQSENSEEDGSDSAVDAASESVPDTDSSDTGGNDEATE
ncbi:MAG: PE-PPE domain-containing protein [Mycobacterium sp.]|nr:PE-PPE domain-containing protein [Mycobacterium sp.]